MRANVSRVGAVLVAGLSVASALTWAASTVATGARAMPGGASSASVRVPRSVSEFFVGLRQFQRGDSPDKSAIGTFAVDDGHLIRWLPHRGFGDALALTGDGRAVYVSRYGAFDGRHARRPCTARVNLTTGRLHRMGICATGLAVSPDGRMLAYTKLGAHGVPVWLVIRDTRTGRHRRVLIYRNCRHRCNNRVSAAELSWAPHDRRLAVSVGYTAAIHSLQILHAWHGRLHNAPSAGRCNGNRASCQEPSFDTHGRLTFTQFAPCPTRRVGCLTEARWFRHRLTVLHYFSRHVYGVIPVVVNAAGSAFIWQTSDGHFRHTRTHLWAHGRTHQLYGTRHSKHVLPALWH